ncbi:hypothetical protein PR048_022867 [Dryococelus australis]|uniref:Uncharacterized protein n=1 Tax=Dryococelus australis TaxID=614101 RepID=A0ABQ9GSI2_9NEOP|nr:hypothetical protein PR048_022867 [Dryococelus australis]
MPIIPQLPGGSDEAASGGATPGFSHVRIVLDDAASRRVFSGISCFPRLLIPVLLHAYLYLPPSALKTSIFRAAQISSLFTHSLFLQTRKFRRHDGNTARLARRSDEALEVRVSVARIAPSLLDRRRVGSDVEWTLHCASPRRRPLPYRLVHNFTCFELEYESCLTNRLEMTERLSTIKYATRSRGRPYRPGDSADDRDLRHGLFSVRVQKRGEISVTASNISVPAAKNVETTVLKWLDYSPPTWVNRVRFPTGSLADFRKWESCRTMPLVVGFSQPTLNCLGADQVRSVSENPEWLGNMRVQHQQPMDVQQKAGLHHAWSCRESKAQLGQRSPSHFFVIRLARSPPAKANRFQSPAGSPDLRRWESCRTMPLVGGAFSGFLPFPTPHHSGSRSIFTSIALIDSQDLARGGVALTSLYLHSGGPVFDSRSYHPDFGFPWFSEITAGECWDGSLTKAMADSFPILPQSFFPVQLAPSLMTSLSTRR